MHASDAATLFAAPEDEDEDIKNGIEHQQIQEKMVCFFIICSYMAIMRYLSLSYIAATVQCNLIPCKKHYTGH